MLAIAGLLGSLLIAPAAPAASIYACQKKKGGTLRIVSSKTKCRKTSEKKISWNTTGPAGKNGANGTNGASGTNGAGGKDGTNGAAGARGPSDAFFDSSDVTALDGTNKVLATVSVPAGVYLVFAGATIQRGGTGGETDCNIRQDGANINSMPYNVLQGSPSPNAYVGAVNGMSAVTLATAATLSSRAGTPRRQPCPEAPSSRRSRSGRCTRTANADPFPGARHSAGAARSGPVPALTQSCQGWRNPC